jgi:hypothetical protein
MAFIEKLKKSLQIDVEEEIYDENLKQWTLEAVREMQVAGVEVSYNSVDDVLLPNDNEDMTRYVMAYCNILLNVDAHHAFIETAQAIKHNALLCLTFGD